MSNNVSYCLISLSVYYIHYFAALSYIIYALFIYALFLCLESQGKKQWRPSLLPTYFMLRLKTRKSNPYMINTNVCYATTSTSLLRGKNLQHKPNLSMILLRVHSWSKLLGSNICRDKFFLSFHFLTMVCPADQCLGFRKKCYHPNTSLDAYNNINWDLTVQWTTGSQTHHPAITFWVTY